MTRRCWVYPVDGSEPVEVTPGAVRTRGTLTDALLWNDRAYQDMGDPRFSSRAQHRAYMRAHGLTTADDFAGTWARARVERDRFYTEAPDPSRRHDIGRAIEQLARGYRPNVRREDS